MIPAAQLVATVAGGANGEPGWAVLACQVFVHLMHRRRPIMDARRFDRAVKALGSGASRRRVLRGLLGSSVVGAVVVSRTVETRAGDNQCPSGHASDCKANQICDNGSCIRCNKKVSVLCKGTFGGGGCCVAGRQCCICPDTPPDTYGVCLLTSQYPRCEDYDSRCRSG